ncbi:MAG: response regulator [Chloroflexota bacterium]|nr:response regulator [Chloroflexota bacterium]
MNKVKMNILVVDDDHRFTSSLNRALDSERFTSVIAANLKDAQESVQRDKPVIIVLGTFLPRGSSFNFHQWLKGDPNLCDIPMIVVDSLPEKRLIKGWTQAEGMRLESEDYISRPIDPLFLASRVEKLLDKTVSRIRVLVVDDHAVVRDGIRAVLDLQRDIQVVGEAKDGKEALDKALELLPDVVLMDVVMPGMNGMEATKLLVSQWDEAKVLMLSQYDDRDTVVSSTESGALGFIPKRSVSAELIEGIRSVSKGKRHVKETIAS